MSRLGIIDRISNRAVDLFKMALLERFENTHLPELYDVLGKDSFLKLIDVFENSTFFNCPSCGDPLKFPSVSDIVEMLRDIAIYLRLHNYKKRPASAEIRVIATEYGMTEGQVRSVFYQMEKRARRYEISVKKP